MSYLFTSESVSEGHPDKMADQISDSILDNFIAFDPHAKVACETLVTTGQVILSGEVKSKTYIDVQEITRNVIEKIGYTKSEYKFDSKSCGRIFKSKLTNSTSMPFEQRNYQKQKGGRLHRQLWKKYQKPS